MNMLTLAECFITTCPPRTVLEHSILGTCNIRIFLLFLFLTAFWQYVKQHLSAHELQRYSRLRHVTTDAGRGRAWIRASLNEHALERYMHMLIEDDRLLW